VTSDKPGHTGKPGQLTF